MYISAAARKVMNYSIVDQLIPRLRQVIKEISQEVAAEDNPAHNDAFLQDYIAQTIIKELAEYLVQASIPEEDWSPILRPGQLRKKYAKAWWK